MWKYLATVLALAASGATAATAVGAEPDTTAPRAPAPAKLPAECRPPLVLCYDRDGDLLPGEDAPSTVRPGDKVTVLVFTTNGQFAADKAAVHVTFVGRPSNEHLFADAAAALQRLGVVGAPPTAATEVQLGAFVSDPVPDDSVDFVIGFERERTNPRTISVDLGYSYYSVAFLVAATFEGDRHVLRDLDTTSDHAVDPALALNIFPGGRQRGIIGYARHGDRWFQNNLGIQIGADLDLTNPTDKLFAGLVFEPVAGFALVGGVSLRKVDVVPAAGALPALADMSGSPTDRRYVVRGYVGVTLTLDLLNTISTLGSSIRGVKRP